MNQRASIICMRVLLPALVLAFSGCGKDKGTGPLVGVGTVHGVVQNTSGSFPIAGASVVASTGATTTTDAQGRFSIAVTADQRTRIDVTKTGFTLNQLVVQLAAGESKSLTVGLMNAGTSASVTPGSGGSVTDAASGAVLSLPADFVTTSGPVTVTVTGLDPTTDQIKALPGGLEAIDANGQPVYLSPVSFAEYTVKDAAGNVLPFNPSASQGADIELPIPASLQGQPGYENGDPIECYVYDPADGKWKTPVPGVIGPSSVNGEPAIKATIFHLSWYGGAPASSDVGCIEGTVRVNGVPAAGVDVEAFPGGSTETNAQGFYRVQAALNTEVRVVASLFNGTTFRTAEGTVHVGSSGATCAILDLALGSEQQGEYEVQGLLISSEDAGTVYDAATVHLTLGTGASEVDVDGAEVRLGSGGTGVVLAGLGGGTYSSATLKGFELNPGATYTIQIDFTDDGSVDATGQVVMVGRPEITEPTAASTVNGQFTSSWDDPGTAVGGYSAYYFGQIYTDPDTSLAAAFITTSRTKFIGDGVVDPVYFLPNDPLVEGDYTMHVLAANGPYWYFIGDTTFVPNVTGPNASGYLSAIAIGNSVNFSSNGIIAVPGPTKATVAGRGLRRGTLPDLRTLRRPTAITARVRGTDRTPSSRR